MVMEVMNEKEKSEEELLDEIAARAEVLNEHATAMVTHINQLDRELVAAGVGTPVRVIKTVHGLDLKTLRRHFHTAERVALEFSKREGTWRIRVQALPCDRGEENVLCLYQFPFDGTPRDIKFLAYDLHRSLLKKALKTLNDQVTPELADELELIEE